MDILILNGTPAKGFSQFRQALEGFEAKLAESNEIKTIDLANLTLSFCNGCFNCWWKTPGICNIHDDIDQISKQVMKADRIVFAAPLIHGYPSALLKKVQDRLIPLLMPYIQLVDGECHHEKRYAHYPDIELFFGRESHTDAEDEKIVSDMYRRLAINFHSKIVNIQFT